MNEHVVATVAHKAIPMLSLPPLPPKPVMSGASLAHRHRLTKIERAFLAVDLANGALRLDPPTLTQAAALAGVSVTYATAARRVSAAARVDIVAGIKPLTTPPVPKRDDDLVELAKSIGSADRWLQIGAAAGLR